MSPDMRIAAAFLDSLNLQAAQGLQRQTDESSQMVMLSRMLGALPSLVKAQHLAKEMAVSSEKAMKVWWDQELQVELVDLRASSEPRLP